MNIVLGVTGGIAAYKAALLARRFVEAGHELHIVPTADALRFVGLPTWEAISRNPVTTSVHDDVPEVRHVALGQQADLIVVAPATANTLAKMTAGLADDLLGTTLLASRAPVLVAPAMHTEMWEHTSTQHNMRVLRERGVHVVGPESGRLTGTDSGPGRMSEPDDIFARAEALLSGEAAEASASDHPASRTPDLHGRCVLVSAGGTREPIDPVRYLGNRSSGRQGVAVAAAAAAAGARVTLLAANIEQAVLAQVDGIAAVEMVAVGSTAELEVEVDRRWRDHDVVIMAAAVADYRVADVADGKIRKEDAAGEGLTLQLVENPDILRGVVEARGAGSTPLIVGFAAETVEHDAELIARGQRKLARKGCDLLAVNAVGWGQGFETDTNELVILERGGEIAARVGGTKREAAEALLGVVAHHVTRG